jgi:ATP dependent DNA ligase domain
MFVPDVKIPLPLGFNPPCLPSPSQKPPSGSAWVHKIKHDGCRLMARKDGNRVRLFTRRGYDWSGKYPWIVEALRCLWVRFIIVDGEAVWAGENGKSVSTSCIPVGRTTRCRAGPCCRPGRSVVFNLMDPCRLRAFWEGVVAISSVLSPLPLVRQQPCGLSDIVWQRQRSASV